MLRLLLTVVFAFATTSNAGWLKKKAQQVKQAVAQVISQSVLIQGAIDLAIENHQNRVDYFEAAVEDIKDQLVAEFGDEYQAVIAAVNSYQAQIDAILDDAAADLSAAIAKLKALKDQIIANIKAWANQNGYGGGQVWNCLANQPDSHQQNGICGVTPFIAFHPDISILDTVCASSCKQCFGQGGSHGVTACLALDIVLAYLILIAKITLYIALFSAISIASANPIYVPEGPQGSEGLIDIVIDQTTMAWALFVLLLCGLAVLGYKMYSGRKKTYWSRKVEQFENEL